MAAAELRDLRARISVTSDVALDVVCKRRGLDRSELVREILDEWAIARVHEAHDLIAGLTAEGLVAPSEGGRGSVSKLRPTSQDSER